MRTSCLLFLLSAALHADAQFTLAEIGRHNSGVFNKSAAEIPAYCPDTKRLFVVNAHSGSLDVLDLTDPARPSLLAVLNVAEDVGQGMSVVNSAVVRNGLLAVAVEAKPKTEPGRVAFYRSAELRLLGSQPVGALPDQLTFSPDGSRVLVANEGEPNADYTVDPMGTVSVIDLASGVEAATVKTLDFSDWNEGGSRAAELPGLKASGLRIFGVRPLPKDGTRPATVAEDIEPEWVEVSADGKTAVVSLQENNAIAVIDLDTLSIARILPLGFKDHGQAGNELDASDKDDGIHLAAYPGLFGVYQPDTIRLLVRDGKTYVITANEGDSRIRPEDDDSVPGQKEGDIFSCETTLKKFDVSGTPFEAVAGEDKLGRLKLIKDLVKAHAGPDGKPTRLFAYGARSFSIFDLADGSLVFDSGSDFERITAERVPDLFNVSNSKDKTDERSRSKGPEPEGLVLGEIDGRTYAFIGLERTGGVMVYDVTEPAKVRFVDYVNTRKAGVPLRLEDKSSNPEAGDLGPEGLVFIPAARSPNGKNLLVVSSEVSGSTTIFEVRK